MTDCTARLIEKIDPRAGPLIMTVFGDAIAPRGTDIWLGSLIEIMAELGLSERLVRTGVYRLTRQNWLQATQQGRRSYYRITSEGEKTFAEADARIYSSDARPWNGKWTIVQILPDTCATVRKTLRDQLTWLGFGQLSPTTMIKPSGPDNFTAKMLDSASHANAFAIFTSALSDHQNHKAIVRNGWDLQEFSDGYKALVSCFAGLDSHVTGNPRRSFIIRTMLIHQYRRILLKDPQLPGELLPADWPGEIARQCVANQYRALSPATDAYLDQTLKNNTQTCPQPTPAYFHRFG
jgi:phenylacetic acid degradation operon negative regulatory protein